MDKEASLMFKTTEQHFASISVTLRGFCSLREAPSGARSYQRRRASEKVPVNASAGNERKMYLLENGNSYSSQDAVGI